MRLLLDTHAYLWWLQDDARLGAGARRGVADPKSAVFVSAASIWEIAIKASLGRIELGDNDLVDEIEANGFLELPVSARHAQAAGALPGHHDDPFDRVLIAQTRMEGLTCVTRDGAFASYDVPTLW